MTWICVRNFTTLTVPEIVGKNTGIWVNTDVYPNGAVTEEIVYHRNCGEHDEIHRRWKI